MHLIWRGTWCLVLGALLACSSDPEWLPTLPSATTGGSDGGSSAEGAGGAGAAGGTTEEIPPEEWPYEPPPPPPPLPQDVVDALAVEMHQALDGPGGTNSALIVGAETGQVIFARNPDQVLKPASNTKLFTTAAALVHHGEEHRNLSRIYATEDASDGIIDGNLVLVCAHDFTSSPFFYPTARTPLDLIADELASAGLSQITGSIRVQGEGVWDGYQFAYYDAAQHRQALATQLRAALIARGIAVGGGTTTGTSFDPPSGANEIARWESLPLMTTTYPINVVSHNEFGDILSRHLGHLDGGGSSYGAGEAVVIDLLAELGVDASMFALNDGSGLSHDNRVSARQTVGLLAGMIARSEGPAWLRSFAVGGVRGTLAGRLGGADTRGRFWGKTGTLTGVIALSGVLEHRHDGQRYLVSLLMNQVSSATAGRSAHNAVVAALARDHRKLGARPEAPVIGCVKNDANDATVIVDFSEVEGAKGYLVWRSPDGRSWAREEARYVTGTSHRTVGFPNHDRLFIRVSAVGEAGESDHSDVYAAAISDDPSSVLVVDANDRWQSEPVDDNILERGHDFIVRVAEGIGEPFDTCDNESLGGSGSLADYEAALWLLGNESTFDETFDASEQDLVRAFVQAGGILLVSGAEIAWDLDAQGSDDDRAFLEEVLGVSYLADDAGTSTLRGLGALASLGRFSFANPGLQRVGFPDVIAAGPNGTVVIEYANGSPAAVRTGTVLVLGFPLENVDAVERRTAIIDLALSGSN